MKSIRVIIVAICTSLAAGLVVGADKPEQLDKATVFGDRELPNVMTIVPWQRPELGDLVSKPVTSLLDQAIEPLDRGVFVREIEYYETLHSSEKTVSSPVRN